jgi:hypothetical protein
MKEFSNYVTIVPCANEKLSNTLYGTYWGSEELHHIHFPIQTNFFNRAQALWSDKVNFHPSILGQDKIEVTRRCEISCEYLNIHSKVKSISPVFKKMKKSVHQMEILISTFLYCYTWL